MPSHELCMQWMPATYRDLIAMYGEIGGNCAAAEISYWLVHGHCRADFEYIQDVIEVDGSMIFIHKERLVQ